METETTTKTAAPAPPDPAAPLYREMTLRVEPRAASTRADGEEDDEDAPIPIAISSEAPVERYDWWEGERYLEVLDHAKESVDLAYAADGMPFLVDHNGREMVGLIENVRVDDDRVLRGEVRFSKSRRARDIRQDMLDGIRKKISVGYRVDRNNLEKSQAQGDALPVVRIKRWTPLEGSTVPIPADYTVGVGRSAAAAAQTGTPNPEAARAAKENSVETQTPTAPAAPAAAAVTADRGADRITQLAELADLHGRENKLGEWIREGRTPESVKEELRAERRAAGQQPINPTAPMNPASIKLSEREEREYSITRGVQALMLGKRGGFEFEVSDSIARQMNRDTNGFFVPTTIRAAHPDALPDTPELRRSLGIDTRTMAAGTAGTGGELKFTEYGGFIDLLRNRSAVLRLGAQMLPGLQGDVGFVGEAAAGSVGWTAEATNISATDVSTNLRKLTPHPLQGARAYTRQLMLQSVYAIENLVRNDLGLGHALEIDRAAIAGTGASNEPRGILNTTGIGAVALGTNGGVPTYDAMVDLESEITADNADISTMAYLTNARMRGRLKKTQMFDGTNGAPVWTGGIEGEANGYRAIASNQVPGNLTKGTSTDCSAILFGVWSEMLIGEWGALEVLVDQLTLGPSVIKLMSIQYVDIFLRQIAAFAACKDARLTT